MRKRAGFSSPHDGHATVVATGVATGVPNAVPQIPHRRKRAGFSSPQDGQVMLSILQTA